MPSPFSIDIAGPMAEGMRIAMARQQMQQSALFRDAELRMAERRAQEQAQYRDELMAEREQRRILQQQMQTDRLNAGAVPADLARELGIVHEPAGDSLMIGDPSGWGGIPFEAPEPAPDDGLQRFTPAQWEMMSPQLQAYHTKGFIDRKTKAAEKQQHWNEIERAIRASGGTDQDVAAARTEFARRRGGMGGAPAGASVARGSSLPQQGTPEYAALASSLMELHPEQLPTIEDAGAYIESRRAGLVNQMRAPGTGVRPFDPTKDPGVVRANRRLERAQKAYEMVQRAVLEATADQTKSVGLPVLTDRESAALRALEQAEADYDRAVEKAKADHSRASRRAPAPESAGGPTAPAGMAESLDARGGYGDPRMNQAQDMQAVESLGGPVMARLRQTLGRNPTREEFRAAMQAAMDELYTPKPAAPAKQPRGPIPASPFADLTKRPQ